MILETSTLNSDQLINLCAVCISDNNGGKIR